MKKYEIVDYKEAVAYIEKYEKNRKEFNYNGYKCEIIRRSSLEHLCGYIYSPDAALRKAAEHHFHGGITYDEGGIIGFDCAHINDMSPNMMGVIAPLWMESYKTMNYVERCLKETIDAAGETTTISSRGVVKWSVKWKK